MRTLEWVNNKLKFIDQRLLPTELKLIETDDYKVIAEAIKGLGVRGAPAIGVAAAYGVALGARSLSSTDKATFLQEVESIGAFLKSTRPTAVNLFWAVDRILDVTRKNAQADIDTIKDKIMAEAQKMAQEDIETNKKIGAYGNELVKEGSRILTHCNAGALATVDAGTALSVIYTAHNAGKNVSVYADETRPLLQGARLTTWELKEHNVPVTLITDNMAGFLMQRKKVDMVIVGADRIAANGDTANKIGTYGVAVLAKEHNIPLYIAAPASTFDLTIESGEQIPIEERNPEEVTHLAGIRIAAEGINVWNPAFDVTPNSYISGIITEKGVIFPPFAENIKKILK